MASAQGVARSGPLPKIAARNLFPERLRQTLILICCARLSPPIKPVGATAFRLKIRLTERFCRSTDRRGAALPERNDPKNF